MNFTSSILHRVFLFKELTLLVRVCVSFINGWSIKAGSTHANGAKYGIYLHHRFAVKNEKLSISFSYSSSPGTRSCGCFL